MGVDLGVIVVLNQQTNLWDASCFNEMCGYGLHTVSDDNPTKAAADRAATGHRAHIRGLLAERQGRNADLGRADWEARAILAEAALAAVREIHYPVPCGNLRHDGGRGQHCAVCEYDDVSGNIWPCPTIRAFPDPGRRSDQPFSAFTEKGPAVSEEHTEPAVPSTTDEGNR